MSYPEHPDAIVVKNKFYPQGLREIDVWNHYQRVKSKLLKEVKNRDIMFFIMVDTNKPIILRRKREQFIRLTPQNYDTLITGRTVSVHAAMNAHEEIGIIDIDIDPKDSKRWICLVKESNF